MKFERLLMSVFFVLAAACGGGGGGNGNGGGGGDDDDDTAVPDGGGGGGDGGGGSGDAGAGGEIDAGVGCGLVTCESAGANCGPIGDGCGGVIQCGECQGTETCGGGGMPSVCGGSSGCVTETCESLGANCGPVGDGCGGLIDSCGECEGTAICGGGGQPSVCSGGAPPCVNLCQQQVDCPAGGTTSVSGTVYTPAGNLPLYNVTVYVPNAPLDAIPTGNDSCSNCDAPLSGEPLVMTTTDAAGNFVLTDMPVGQDIPLVIQAGKWRRLITIPTVAECVDTPLAAATTSFPRRQGEGGVPENNIPRIALTTGGADALECLMRKIGVADAEFTNPAAAGRVNLYAGHGGTNRYQAALNGGASFPVASGLWSSADNMNDYDMVVLSCEGAGDWPAGEPPDGNTADPGFRDPSDLAAMKDYLDRYGGRVFGSHWHHSWVELGPDPMPTVGTFTHRNDPPIPFVVTVNQAFPKGAALAQWLINVTASTVLGQLSLRQAQHTIDDVEDTLALRWMSSTNPNAGNAAGVPYMSFNTPIGVPDDEKCGRMVVTDIHVSNTDDSGTATGLRFPGGCTSTNLLPEEKALIFLLFDLASCVTTDVPTCTVRRCEDVGAECGPLADGCGGILDCGTCTPPDTCGGGGTPYQCGNDGCVETTCEQAGAECGTIADGCGGSLECGTCTPPETCGGGGHPNVCEGGVD
jgi:hypothetical protein